MRRLPRTPFALTLFLSAAILWTGAPAVAQTIDPFFAGTYFADDIGSVPGLPPLYGGLTFKAGDPNTILIGGNANTASGALYSIGVTRGAGNHITGFTESATFFADAAYNDGGVVYGPDGVLFLARWPVNELGQIKPGSTTTDKIIDLNPFGVDGSLAGLTFVPPGFPGAGELKAVTYGGGEWSTFHLAPDGTGTFDLVSVTQETYIGGGPEGIFYVPFGSPLFGAPTVLVSEYGAGSVGVYDIDGNGDPIPETRRTFMTGLFGAEGAIVDPLTGDYIFSTFGGGNRVVVVSGFVSGDAHIWNIDASGNWTPDANWTGGQPNGAGVSATFGGIITAPRVVTLDAPKTVGNIVFDNLNSYTLVGQMLTMDGGGTINTATGTHEIAAGLSFAAGNTVTKTGSGTLTISGHQSHGPDTTLIVAAGTLDLLTNAGRPPVGPAIADANLAIRVTGGLVNFRNRQEVRALDVDESDAAAVIDFATDSFDQVRIYDGGTGLGATVAQATIDAVWQDVASGNNGGGWDGLGIRTTTIADANVNGLGLVLEMDVSGAEYLGVREMVLGDVNGDDFVDSGDAATLFGNLGADGTWLTGDMNYDLFIDAGDAGVVFAALGQAFDPGFGPVAVPEPSTLALLAIGLAGILRWRRSR